MHVLSLNIRVEIYLHNNTDKCDKTHKLVGSLCSKGWLFLCSIRSTSIFLGWEPTFIGGLFLSYVHWSQMFVPSCFFYVCSKTILIVCFVLVKLWHMERGGGKQVMLVG